MTLEELWHLFPIFLVPHNPNWEAYYEEERALLLRLLQNLKIRRIEHIGSTAIPNIQAKNIIDILIEVNSNDFTSVKTILLLNHYLLMSESATRMSFNKGYTEDGFLDKVFHIHIRQNGDVDELYFRDYLLKYPRVAKQYEQLKLVLAEQYKYNRDLYTENKSSFIKNILKQAKKEIFL